MAERRSYGHNAKSGTTTAQELGFKDEFLYNWKCLLDFFKQFGRVPVEKVLSDDLALLQRGGGRRRRRLPQLPNGTKRHRPGQLEVSLSFDHSARILYATVARGRNLKSTENPGGKPNAFVVGYLLPERR